MKVEENLYYAELFDIYRGLLTKLQQQALESFLDENLTLSEIAENEGVSRQAVKDSIDKALSKLASLEEKVGFHKRLKALEGEIEKLKNKGKIDGTF